MESEVLNLQREKLDLVLEASVVNLLLDELVVRTPQLVVELVVSALEVRPISLGRGVRILADRRGKLSLVLGGPRRRHFAYSA